MIHRVIVCSKIMGVYHVNKHTLITLAHEIVPILTNVFIFH
jgi:hypothetical protein